MILILLICQLTGGSKSVDMIVCALSTDLVSCQVVIAHRLRGGASPKGIAVIQMVAVILVKPIIYLVISSILISLHHGLVSLWL